MEPSTKARAEKRLADENNNSTVVEQNKSIQVKLLIKTRINQKIPQAKKNLNRANGDLITVAGALGHAYTMSHFIQFHDSYDGHPLDKPR